VYKVVHGFNKNILTHGAAGACNVDVACAFNLDSHPEIYAVGMILTDDHQRYCSGALINNVKGDGKQFFLTAQHCVFSDVSYFIIGFNYLYDQCVKRNRGVKATAREPQIRLVQGLRLVASWDRTDFALLEIKERIPDAYNVYMAGFDLSLTPATNVHCLHHPSGDVMKVSTYRGALVAASWSEAPETFHWQVPAWNHGVTERGSSGSPLFNEKGHIVAHLRGGQSSCEYPKGYDLFGALSSDWVRPEKVQDRLSFHLNPDNAKNVAVVLGTFLSELREKA
jgi:lysyl endopeptidase